MYSWVLWPRLKALGSICITNIIMPVLSTFFLNMGQCAIGLRAKWIELDYGFGQASCFSYFLKWKINLMIKYLLCVNFDILQNSVSLHLKVKKKDILQVFNFQEILCIYSTYE